MNLDLSIVLKTINALDIGVLTGLERSLIPSSPATCESDATDAVKQPEPPETLLGVRTFSVLSLGC